MKAYQCENCGAETLQPRVRRINGKDEFLCRECDDLFFQRMIAEKELAADAAREKREEEEKEKAERSREKRAAAYSVLNSFIASSDGTTKERMVVDAVQYLRSAWNKDKTLFFAISGGGKMVRFWTKNSPNLPRFAR